mgnify:FL=1
MNKLNKVGEIDFNFPHNADWNQMVHVYLSENWIGEPAESEEMKPEWFSVSEIPFTEMWPADVFWIPKVLDEELIKAKIVFGEKDAILDKEIEIVKSL